jgi:hypothetical protein
MKLRVVSAFALAILGAAAMAAAQSRAPNPVPPANPPHSILEVLCSYLPNLPFCD